MNHRHTTDEPKALSATFPRYSIWTQLRTMAALALGYVLLLAYLHYQGDSDIRRIFGGSAGLSVIRNADRVEVYRIDKLADKFDFHLEQAGLPDYPILKGPVLVPQSDAQTLSRTLQDRNSYPWNAAKGCIPRPGVRLDFIRGGDRLSVLLCFECDILETYLNGKPVSGQSFDYARPILVRVIRSIFPDDIKIQSLPEQHGALPPDK